MSDHNHSYSDQFLCQDKSVSDETGWGESQEEALFLVLEFAGWWTGLPQNAAQLESFLALAQSLTHACSASVAACTLLFKMFYYLSPEIWDKSSDIFVFAIHNSSMYLAHFSAEWSVG